MVPGEDRPALDGIERQGASFMPRLFESLRDHILLSQVLCEARHSGQRFRCRPVARQPRAHRRIGELRAIADQSAIHIAAADATGGRHREIDDDRGSIFVGTKRGEIRREALRQHREDAGRGVNGRRIDGGVRIHRTNHAAPARQRRRWRSGCRCHRPRRSATDS